MMFDFGNLLENADMMGYNEEGEMDDLGEKEMADYLANAVLKDPLQVLRRLWEECMNPVPLSLRV